jgi:Flp pilus assembly protein TadG
MLTMWRAHSFRRLQSEERGAALVEFALVVPLLMVMMCAIIDFGLALHRLNNLNSAVREGARFGAVRQNLTPAIDSVRTRVQDYWRSIGSDTLPRALITVAETTDVSGLRSVVVRVTGYEYRPVTPLAPLFGMGTLRFTRTAIYRQEFQ